MFRRSALTGAIAAAAISLSHPVAAGEVHSLLDVAVSNLSVEVSHDGGLTFVAVPFATGANQSGIFAFGMTDTANLVPPGGPVTSSDAFSSLTTGFSFASPGLCNANCVDPAIATTGSMVGVGENTFTPQGPGDTDGSQSDSILFKTNVTGVQVGTNLLAINEADVLPPPDPILGTGSITDGIMRWTFCTTNSTICPVANRLSPTDLIRVSGNLTGTILAEVLGTPAPFDVGSATVNISSAINGSSILSHTVTRSASAGNVSSGGLLTALGDTFFTGTLAVGDFGSSVVVPFNISFSSSAAALADVQAAPEPGSLGLMGAGLLGLAAIARRRSHRAL